MVSQLVLVPLAGLLACGVASVALAPRSTTSRAMLAGGASLVLAWMLEQAAVGSVGIGGVLARVGSDGAFLLGLAALVGTLLCYPGDRLGHAWQRVLVALLVLLAPASAVARLIGQERVSVGLDPTTEVANPLVVHGLGRLGTLGAGVVATEPAWLLGGIAVLVWRWARAAGPLRQELGRVVLSVALLAVLLALVVVGNLAGAPLPDVVTVPLFLAGFTLLPFELLRGVTRRARSMERELVLSRQRIVEAEDRARRRIERDLHDGVQQQLVAVLSLAELAAHQVASGSGRGPETLAELRGVASTAITDLRELVHGIRPPVLEDRGLAAALETRLARMPATVTTDLDGVGDRRFPPELEAAAYFVAGEALANALKHAPGAPVHLSLTATDDTLTVSVRDEGPGLATSGGADGPGTGLQGLADRVESLGGRLEVESQDGCTVRAELPTRTTP